MTVTFKNMNSPQSLQSANSALVTDTSSFGITTN